MIERYLVVQELHYANGDLFRYYLNDNHQWVEDENQAKRFWGVTANQIAHKYQDLAYQVDGEDVMFDYYIKLIIE